MTSYQPMPSGPPPQQLGAKGPPPSTVRNAVLLMFISAGLSLIGLITEFALKDQIRDQIKKDNPYDDPSRVDSLVNTTVTIAVVLGAVLLVLYLLLAVQVRKGKNWARIVTWVFAGLGVLSLLSVLAGNAPTVNRVLGVIGGLIDIALIILLALAPSNAYFRKQPQFGSGYPPAGYQPQAGYPGQSGYPPQQQGYPQQQQYGQGYPPPPDR